MKIVRILQILLVFGFTRSEIQANELLKYEKFVDEIVSSFSMEMEKEFNLECVGSGGRMPHDVEEIEVRFVAYWEPTFEKAREMEVKAIKSLLDGINSHKKIKPFLRESPFTANRIHISLSFREKNDEYRLNGTVAYVYSTRNKIFYDKAEIKPEKTNPLIDAKTGKIEYITQPASQKLVTFKEEAYEDAVKIVDASRTQNEKI